MLYLSPFWLCDVIYDQSYNDSFHDKLECYQYKAALVMTRAIKEPSSERLYQELGMKIFVQSVGLENYAFFTKCLKTNHLHIYFI